MKKEIRISYRNHSANSGYYSEDDWSKYAVVTNKNDVFEFMKECHLCDASNRNNYPIVSYWGRCVEYEEVDYEICNLGHKHYAEYVDITRPDFHEAGYEMYLKWEKKLKHIIPTIRKMRDNLNTLKREKEQYEKLKEKFERENNNDF